MVYSTTKGMAAMCFAVAHSRGWFHWDDPVAKHWPAFAQHGKDAITVRELLSHRAGLVALDVDVDTALLADHDAMARVLERQRPLWQPGTRAGYHAITFGFYSNALLKRLDRAHRTLGRFFQDEIAKPLDVTFHIGLPESLDARLATIVDFHPLQALRSPRHVPWRLALALYRRNSLASRALRNPRVEKPSEFSGPVLRRLELPSSNGVGEVRALARIYGDAAAGGSALGLNADTLSALMAMPDAPSGGWGDPVLGGDARFSLGFSKPNPLFDFAGPTAFGTPGLGGSFGFAEPALELGFAYAPNRLGMFLRNDPRELALRRAARACAMRMPRNA